MWTGRGPTARRWVCVSRRVALALLTAALLLWPAPAAPSAAYAASLPADCADVVPIEQITPGMRGTGYTVVEGTQPQPFAVEVVGLLENAIAPGIPMILVRASGLLIDELGVWLGMSGSPVYDESGRLLGALAYGLSATAGPVAGLTPAAQTAELLGAGTAVAGAAASAPLQIRVADDLAQAAGISGEQAAAGLRRLPLPFTATGLSPTRLSQFSAAFERSPWADAAVLNAQAMPPTGTASASARPQAGGNFAAALSYGDAQLFATGTVTQVCDDIAAALGHPLLLDGDVQFGANVGDALLISDDRPFAGFKVLNLGARVGVIDQDRLAGLRIRLGNEPDITNITSSITNAADPAATRHGETAGIFAPLLPMLVEAHLYANYDLLVFNDASLAGMAETSWTVRGTGQDGREWSYEYANRVADSADLAAAAVQGLIVQLAQLQANPFEQVRITSVEYEAVAGQPFTQYQIVAAEVSVDGAPFEPGPALEVAPGSQLLVRVTVDPYRGEETQVVEVGLDVPADFVGGTLEVRGGDIFAIDPFVCMADPQICAAAPVTSLDEMLDNFSNAPRGDELVVALVSSVFDEMQPPLAATNDVVTRLDRPVRGFVAFDLVPSSPVAPSPG